jgi:hypothetical protein
MGDSMFEPVQPYSWSSRRMQCAIDSAVDNKAVALLVAIPSSLWMSRRNPTMAPIAALLLVSQGSTLFLGI